MDHVDVVVDHFFVSLPVLDVTLNGRSRDFVDPRLLNFHLGPAEMNVEVFAHAISIFHPFLSDLSVQLMAVVQPMVMNDSYLRILHRYLISFWSIHWMTLRNLWSLCVRICSLTRSRPSP